MDIFFGARQVKDFEDHALQVDGNVCSEAGQPPSLSGTFVVLVDASVIPLKPLLYEVGGHRYDPEKCREIAVQTSSINKNTCCSDSYKLLVIQGDRAKAFA